MREKARERENAGRGREEMGEGDGNMKALQMGLSVEQLPLTPLLFYIFSLMSVFLLTTPVTLQY